MEELVLQKLNETASKLSLLTSELGAYLAIKNKSMKDLITDYRYTHKRQIRIRILKDIYKKYGKKNSRFI